jgi:hypothetical protein
MRDARTKWSASSIASKRRWVRSKRWCSTWGQSPLSDPRDRELGPKGLHVAHVVIDGLIDIAFSREHFAQRVVEAGSDGSLNPDHVAEAYWWLHNLPCDAWTFELGLRPAAERW